MHASQFRTDLPDMFYTSGGKVRFLYHHSRGPGGWGQGGRGVKSCVVMDTNKKLYELLGCTVPSGLVLTSPQVVGNEVPPHTTEDLA